MKQYAKVVREGQSYTSHTKAAEYGCVKYHHTLNLPGANNGDILQVVKNIMVNNYDLAYILRDENEVEYIIGKSGVELLINYKPMSKVEAPKPFLVKGDSKHLLKACYEEIIALGYEPARRHIDDINGHFSTNVNKVDSSTTLEFWKEIYINGGLGIDPEFEVFTLPQDYNKAIEHAKEAISSPYWTQKKVQVMKFGSMSIEVEQGKGWVKIDDGIIKKEDLKKILDFFDKSNRPKLLGYILEFKVPQNEIKFGCKHGLISELTQIYNAM